MTDRIPVMFDRALKPQWIDYGLSVRFTARSESQFAEVVRTQIADELGGPDALRKTVGLLQRTVGFRSSITESRLHWFFDKMASCSPDGRSHLRLQLLKEAHPFFADCTNAMDRLGNAGTAGIDLRTLYDRITPLYGERDTVRRCVRYVLTTLLMLGYARNESRRWYYIATTAPER